MLRSSEETSKKSSSGGNKKGRTTIFRVSQTTKKTTNVLRTPSPQHSIINGDSPTFHWPRASPLVQDLVCWTSIHFHHLSLFFKWQLDFRGEWCCKSEAKLKSSSSSSSNISLQYPHSCSSNALSCIQLLCTWWSIHFKHWSILGVCLVVSYCFLFRPYAPSSSEVWYGSCEESWGRHLSPNKDGHPIILSPNEIWYDTIFSYLSYIYSLFSECVRYL